MSEESSGQPIMEQEIRAFLDCQGNMFVFSPHNTPQGTLCVATGNRLKSGVPFVIDLFDERNGPQASTYYGQCGICRAKLILPKKNLQANC